MATTVTFTTCKEIHFVECIWTFDKYLKEGGMLEKETLKRLKLPQILECSFKRQVPVNYDL